MTDAGFMLMETGFKLKYASSATLTDLCSFRKVSNNELLTRRRMVALEQGVPITLFSNNVISTV